MTTPPPCGFYVICSRAAFPHSVVFLAGPFKEWHDANAVLPAVEKQWASYDHGDIFEAVPDTPPDKFHLGFYQSPYLPIGEMNSKLWVDPKKLVSYNAS